MRSRWPPRRFSTQEFAKARAPSILRGANRIPPPLSRLRPLLVESRLTLVLALPLVIGQLSQMLLGVADTLMVGRLGEVDLAALGFATALFHVPFVFGLGLLTAVSVVTSNAIGADKSGAARASCRHGLYLGLALGGVLALLACPLANRLDIFGQAPSVARDSRTYFLVSMVSLAPALGSIALKNHADALNRPWVPFWIFLGGVVLNVILNALLIFGLLGLPALGIDGAAWATLVSRIAILGAMLWWLNAAPGLAGWVPVRWFLRPVAADFRSLLKIGLPASLQMLAEVGAFTTAGILMGRFGAVPLAAHQIAITCASTAFMVPLGLSMALTVRAGQAAGAGSHHRLRPIVQSGWLLGLAFAVCTAAVFTLAGREIAGWFIGSDEVVAMCAKLFVIVGIFQCFDSLQVCSAGMLRGLHDARVPALIAAMAYWLAGIPLGAWLANATAVGPPGVWWGLAIGLAVACVLLGRRLWKLTATAAVRRPE